DFVVSRASRLISQSREHPESARSGRSWSDRDPAGVAPQPSFAAAPGPAELVGNCRSASSSQPCYFGATYTSIARRQVMTMAAYMIALLVGVGVLQCVA